MPEGDFMTSRWERRRAKSREMIRRHYYDRGWTGAYRRYESLLAETIHPGGRVLDIGCGREFPMAAFLKSLGAEVHGLDPIYGGPATDGEVAVRRGEAEAIPYDDGTFDTVVSRSVLEHLRHPEAAFAEFRRVLRGDGRVVFLAPNRYDYVSLAARLIPNRLHGKVMKSLEGREDDDTFATFYRANSARQLRRIASRTGLEIERLEYVNHHPYLLKFSPLLCRLGIVYDDLICRHESLHWLQAWLLGVMQRT